MEFLVSGTIWEKINSWISGLISKILQPFYNLQPWLQLIILVVAAILVVFGVFAVIKKSWKILVALAAICVIVFVVNYLINKTPSDSVEVTETIINFIHIN